MFRNAFRLASCWKGFDAFKGKSKPSTKHTKSILGSRGKFKKWSIHHGLRDPRPNGVEAPAVSGGVRAGSGLFGARARPLTPELRAGSAERLDELVHGVPNICNRLRGKPLDNPMIGSLIQSSPIAYHVALFANNRMAAAADVSQRVTIEKILAALENVRATRAADRIEAFSLVRNRSYVGMPWVDAVGLDAEAIAALLRFTSRRDAELRGVMPEADTPHYVDARDELQASWKASKRNFETLRFPAADPASKMGLVGFVDQRLSPSSLIMLTAPLHGMGRDNAATTHSTIRWWWKAHDPSRQVNDKLCGGSRGDSSTSHRISLTVVIPFVQIAPELGKALQRRQVQEAQESADQALESIDRFCANADCLLKTSCAPKLNEASATTP